MQWERILNLKERLMIKKIFILIVTASLFLVVGCQKKGQEIEAKSLEAIYREEGIPVKVEEVLEQDFTRYQTYYSEVLPSKNTQIFAKYEDRIAKINASAGDFVKKGQVIIEFNPNNRFGIKETQANYDIALATYNRMTEVFKTGGISQQELDTYETQLKVAQAAIENINDMLRVKAPYDGYITELPVSENDYIFIDTALFTISNLNSLKSVLWVNENDIKFVREGMFASAKWNGQEISGQVDKVAMAMDAHRRAFRVEASFDNAKRSVKAGVTSEINLLLYKKANVIGVPTVMVREIESSPYLWVVEDNKAVRKNVVLGQTGNDLIEILNGLKAGDVLITEGYHLVSDDDKVTIK
jgi:RND family efflux transporter MFP subunit